MMKPVSCRGLALAALATTTLATTPLGSADAADLVFRGQRRRARPDVIVAHAVGAGVAAPAHGL